MSYYISFRDDRDSIIIDDVRTFILLGDKTVVICEDDTEISLLDILSISAHFYNEG